MDEAPEERRVRAASRILELADQFGQRSHDLQVDLVREFQDAVAEHAALIGPIGIEDDDDEQLALGRDGRFRGRLLEDTDGSDGDGAGAGAWQEVGDPSDVVDHYDPVDLFADLADAILELFPELDEPPAESQAGEDVPDSGSGEGGDRDDAPEEAAESGSRKVLRDLHEAGVYSDAEYASKLAELDRSESR